MSTKKQPKVPALPETIYGHMENDGGDDYFVTTCESLSTKEPEDGPIGVYKLVKTANLKRTIKDELV